MGDQAKSNAVLGYKVSHEADGTWYQFTMVQNDFNRMALVDHRGRWILVVNRLHLVYGQLAVAVDQEMTSPSFTLSKTDIHNILTAAHQVIKQAEQNELIEELKKLAEEHYNDGGDQVVECWDRSDFVEFIESNPVDYRREMLKLFGLLEDRRKDIEGTANW